MVRPIVLFHLCLVFAACEDEALRPSAAPAQSNTLAATADALYAASPDHDAVAVLDRGTGDVRLVPVGDRPARVARANDLLLVTLQGERSVAVLSLPELETVAQVDVGAEPIGVVVTPEQTSAWVAVSLADEVLRIDLERFEIAERIRVPDQPRWLALHPTEPILYVASMMQGRLAWIDLERGVAHDVELPPLAREELDFQSGERHVRTFARRFTGDPAVSPDGAALYVPTLSVNNATPLAAATSTTPVFFGGYQNRVAPAVLQLPLDTAGGPLPARSLPLGITGLPLVAPQAISLSGSYPTSVSIAPGGEYLVAPLEGLDLLAIFGLTPAPVAFESSALTGGRSGEGDAQEAGEFGSGTLAIPGRRPGLSAPAGAAQAPFAFVVRTDAGPRGAAFTEGGRIFIESRFDRTIAQLDGLLLRDLFRGEARALSRIEVFGSTRIGESTLTREQERGRRLFFAVNDGVVAGPNANISCATCHFEGRNDGLTWTFAERGPRQTPSLAGAIGQTAPFGWEGAEPTVADEALATSHDRMGGALTKRDAEAISAWLQQTPDVDPPVLYDASVDRGRMVFERAGCAACHNGPRLTDNAAYDLYGVDGIVTRSLVGIAASPPYLHDGSAATLEELLRRLEDGPMGSTADLSAEELEDLERYLLSL